MSTQAALARGRAAGCAGVVPQLLVRCAQFAGMPGGCRSGKPCVVLDCARSGGRSRGRGQRDSISSLAPGTTNRVVAATSCKRGDRICPRTCPSPCTFLGRDLRPYLRSKRLSPGGSELPAGSKPRGGGERVAALLTAADFPLV